MPRKSLILFLAVVVAAALGVSRAISAEDSKTEIATMKQIVDQVEEYYVADVKPKTLYDGAYRGLLATLDPYSQYFDKKQTTEFAAETEGEFGGLGIEISLRDGILTIVSPIRGTPAYEAGILPGDLILKIDGKSTERISLEQAVDRLRGTVGSKVTLTVRHIGAPMDTEITLQRAVIKPPSVEGGMIDEKDGIGYVRLNSFTAKVADELTQMLRELQEKNLKGLIIDLRGNPGGLLDKAVEVANDFLPEGVTVVSVKGRRPEMNRVYRARKGMPAEWVALPVVVIVDEGSASASEILAAALHDNKRAMLVGARTYGKGSVQNVFDLGNGQSLKLTTARYYTPDDKPIEDRQGIMPDIYMPMSREHQLALRNQEREDKLRGSYRLGGDLKFGAEPPAAMKPENPGAPAAPAAPAAPPEEKNQTPEAEARPGRVVDFQLQAALNILEWQDEQGTPVAKAGAKAAK